MAACSSAGFGPVGQQQCEEAPRGGGKVPIDADEHPEASRRLVALESHDGEPVARVDDEARDDADAEARLDVALERAPAGDLDDGVEVDAERPVRSLAELSGVGFGRRDDGGEARGLLRRDRRPPRERVSGRGR